MADHAACNCDQALDLTTRLQRLVARAREGLSLDAELAEAEAALERWSSETMPRGGGEPPFGWMISEKAPSRLVPCPEERAIIDLVLALNHDGLGAHRIASELERSGAVSPRSRKPLHKTSVARILARWAEAK